MIHRSDYKLWPSEGKWYALVLYIRLSTFLSGGLFPILPFQFQVVLKNAGSISSRFLGGRERRAVYVQKYCAFKSQIRPRCIISCRSPFLAGRFTPVCLCHALFRWSKKRVLWNCLLVIDSSLLGACGWWNKLAKICLLGLKIIFQKGFCTSRFAWLSSMIHENPSSSLQNHLNNVYTLQLAKILRYLYNASIR